jgi:hypothetical protein
MNIKTTALIATATLFAATTASAQYSHSGPGASIPLSGTGGGGSYPGTLPPNSAFSVINVPVATTNVDSVTITNLNHTFVGDLSCTLTDPTGLEHLLWLRPGGGSDFTGNGDYVFVEFGAPTMSTNSNISPGTYNQSFSQSGGTPWISGTAGIYNTPLTQINGPAGDWTLTVYDWAGGDIGAWSGWKIGGNGGGGAGIAYCLGDGSGVICPCFAFGAQGEGCQNSTGSGGKLIASGAAFTGFDTFSLNVTGLPANKPGLFFQGVNQLSNPVGDGILCSNSTLRYPVTSSDSNGQVTQAGLAANATPGQSLNYQFWYRDPGQACGGGFNFTNA